MAHIVLDRDLTNTEYEQLLLNELIFNEKKSEIIKYCYPSLFTKDEHREIYSAIRILDGNADVPRVIKIVVDKSELPDHISKRLLQETLMYTLCNDPIFKYWSGKYTAYGLIKLLKELLFRRTILDRATSLANIAESTPADTCIEEVEKQVNKISILDRKLMRAKEERDISKMTSDNINDNQ